jgi:hypothetical protein
VGREVFPAIEGSKRLGLPNLPPSGYKSFREPAIITPATGAGNPVINLGEKARVIEQGGSSYKLRPEVIEQGETIIQTTEGKLKNLLKTATQEEKRVIKSKLKSAGYNPESATRGQKEITKNPRGSRVIERKLKK